MRGPGPPLRCPPIGCGSGAPDDADGADGDLYLDLDFGTVYTKDDGEWTAATNLVGPAGEDGEAGEQGPQGDPGAPGEDAPALLTGSGAPAATLGNEGDIYLARASGAMYLREASDWTLIGNVTPATNRLGPGGLHWGTWTGETSDTATASWLTDPTPELVFASVSGAPADNAGITGTFAPSPIVVDLSWFDTLVFEADVTEGETIQVGFENGRDAACIVELVAEAGSTVDEVPLADFECYGEATLHKVTAVSFASEWDAGSTFDISLTSIAFVDDPALDPPEPPTPANGFFTGSGAPDAALGESGDVDHGVSPASPSPPPGEAEKRSAPLSSRRPDSRASSAGYWRSGPPGRERPGAARSPLVEPRRRRFRRRHGSCRRDRREGLEVHQLANPGICVR
ncbi:MAG: hypothetical protein JW751_02410 [Polyangiaceae bacterium]|nr:hypothetical protein [Polyangiaceae bacterium]